MNSEIDLEREKVAILRAQLELEKTKIKERSFLERHLAAILTTIASLMAVFVTASQIWLVNKNKQQEIRLNDFYQSQAQKIEQQDSDRDQVRLSNEIVEFVLDNEDRIKSKNPEERVRISKLIENIYPPSTVKIIFEYITTITDDKEWDKKLAEYIAKTKIQNVYLFRITPNNDVNAEELESDIKNKIFPSLTVLQRNVKSSRHTLFRGDTYQGRTSFLWMLNMELYGRGTAVGGVEKILNQMQEKLGNSATLTQAYITSI